MEEQKTQFRLWHLFEATAWAALAAAIWTQLGAAGLALLLPFVVAMRFTVADELQCEWLTAGITCLCIFAGTGFGIAFAGAGWLMGDWDPVDVVSILPRLLLLGAWVGTLVAISCHPWWREADSSTYV